MVADRDLWDEENVLRRHQMIWEQDKKMITKEPIKKYHRTFGEDGVAYCHKMWHAGGGAKKRDVRSS